VKQGRPRRGGTGRAPALSVSFPSETSFLGLVRDLTQKMAEAAGFDEKTAGGVALAVDEAATNVMEHAYHGATDQEVEVHFDDQGDSFEVEILDKGARVQAKEVPHVNLEKLEAYARERRTGGLGIPLMAKIMDQVTFGRVARRNVCRLVKRKAEKG
jgi:anti-sigma regulatory factor (Ser/Thr protein kinase)